MFKTYEAADEIEKDGAWWPTSVRLRQLDERYSAAMKSEYWMSPKQLQAEFFTASVDQQTFLARVESLLGPLGVAGRLAAEIAESERVIREHDAQTGKREE